MRLIDNWNGVAKRAWSIKFNIGATLLSSAETSVALLQPPGIPAGLFAAMAACLSVLANVARLLAQEEIDNGQ
jgi:hypothetical protein